MFLSSISLQISNDTKYLAIELTREIAKSDNADLFLQYFLTIAVIATAFITFWYNRKTHAQTEREMKIRLRPVLARLHSMDKKSPELKDNGWIEGESYRYNQKKISIHFINNGALPANSVSSRYYVGLLRENGLLSDKIQSEKVLLPDLSPHEHYSIDIPWEPIHGDHASEKDDCYFGLEIEYSTKDSKESYVYAFDGYLKDRYLMIEKSNIT